MNKIRKGTKLSIAVQVVDKDFGAGDFLLQVVDGLCNSVLAPKSSSCFLTTF